MMTQWINLGLYEEVELDAEEVELDEDKRF